MQYIMVLYEVDSNSILVQEMRNRTSGEMISAYNALVARLKLAGFEPKTHLLDNECSHEYKDAITKNGMTYQLVPPHDHGRNVGEKAIQTFKDHFVAFYAIVVDSNSILVQEMRNRTSGEMVSAYNALVA